MHKFHQVLSIIYWFIVSYFNNKNEIDQGIFQENGLRSDWQTYVKPTASNPYLESTAHTQKSKLTQKTPDLRTWSFSHSFFFLASWSLRHCSGDW